MHQEQLANRVYELVCGNWDIDNYPIPESYLVQDEFYPGSDCSNAYDAALAAYSRLCVRLGTEDLNDGDIEEIFTSFLEICELVGIKMFYYGQLLAGKAEENA